MSESNNESQNSSNNVQDLKYSEKDHFTIQKKMINGKEVDRKCCNYCTKDFSATTSSGNLKGHLNVHDLFKKKTFEINLPLMKFMKLIN